MEIVDYRPEYRGAFEALVLEWVEKLFRVETADRPVLDDPEAALLRPGGFIFLARSDGELVGTCGLSRRDAGTLELVKLSVTAHARGRGVGELLTRFCVERARRAGARRIVLETNSRLDAANAVYAKLGFTPDASVLTGEFDRADLGFALRLPPPDPILVVGCDRLAACHAVRRRVFIKGQGVPEEVDLDGQDPYCTQLLALDGEAPIGTARLRDAGEAAKVERVAVVEERRGTRLGRALMRSLEEEAQLRGHTQIVLNAQSSQIGFYDHLGYVSEGGEFIEADIRHQAMRKRLAI